MTALSIEIDSPYTLPFQKNQFRFVAKISVLNPKLPANGPKKQLI